MNEYTELDIARLAAYIDGEGCISIHHKRSCMSVAVSNTDPRLIQWIQQRFGGDSYRYAGQSRNRRWMYRWEVRAGRASDLLKLLIPYFVIKKDQAEIAIAFNATVKRGRGGNHCTKSMDSGVLEVRHQLYKKLRFLHHDAPGNPNLEKVN